MSTRFIANEDTPTSAIIRMTKQVEEIQRALFDGCKATVDADQYKYLISGLSEHGPHGTSTELGVMIYQDKNVLLHQEYVTSVEDVDRFFDTWSVFQRHLNNDAVTIKSFLGKVEINDRTVDGVNQYLVNQTASLISEGKVA